MIFKVFCLCLLVYFDNLKCIVLYFINIFESGMFIGVIYLYDDVIEFVNSSEEGGVYNE